MAGHWADFVNTYTGIYIYSIFSYFLSLIEVFIRILRHAGKAEYNPPRQMDSELDLPPGSPWSIAKNNCVYIKEKESTHKYGIVYTDAPPGLVDRIIYGF